MNKGMKYAPQGQRHRVGAWARAGRLGVSRRASTAQRRECARRQAHRADHGVRETRHVFPVEQPRGVVLAGHLRYVTPLIKASAVRRIGFLPAPTKPPAARLICRADVARADAYKTGAYRYFSGTRVRPHVEIQAHRGPPTAPPFVEKGERKGIHASLGTIPRRQRHTHPLRSMYTPLPLRNRLSTCCLRTLPRHLYLHHPCRIIFFFFCLG